MAKNNVTYLVGEWIEGRSDGKTCEITGTGSCCGKLENQHDNIKYKGAFGNVTQQCFMEIQ